MLFDTTGLHTLLPRVLECMKPLFWLTTERLLSWPPCLPTLGSHQPTFIPLLIKLTTLHCLSMYSSTKKRSSNTDASEDQLSSCVNIPHNAINLVPRLRTA